MKDFYYILGITQSNTDKEIKSAYRKLSKKFHPDKNEGDKFFEERFKEIQEAYEVLSDITKRDNYDEKLKNFTSSQSKRDHSNNMEEELKRKYEEELRRKEAESKRKYEEELRRKEAESKQKYQEAEGRLKEKFIKKRTVVIFAISLVIISFLTFNTYKNELKDYLMTKQYINQADNIKLPISFEFKSYINADKRFTIEYPSFLTIESVYQNNDGSDFKSEKGEICLRAYSSSFFNHSISELYGQELQDENFAISYKVLKLKWYVISGINKKNGKEFYKKVYHSNNIGDQFRTMSIEYPMKNHNDFDIIIPRLIRTFKDI